MNIHSLCIGNIVSLAYNPDVITTIHVIEIGGSVQVACNNYTDDIRDIIGVPLKKETLKRFKIPTKIINNNMEVTISCKNDKVYISSLILQTPIQIQYLHELQNLVLFFMGIAIINDRKFRI